MIQSNSSEDNYYGSESEIDSSDDDKAPPPQKQTQTSAVLQNKEEIEEEDKENTPPDNSDNLQEERVVVITGPKKQVSSIKRHVTLDTTMRNDGKHLVEAADVVFRLEQKIERLEALLTIITRENFFDDEDTKTLKAEIHMTKSSRKEVLSTLSKNDKKELSMRIILKQREHAIEKAVRDEVVKPEDDLIFTFLVQKQCSLTSVIDRR